MLSLILILVNIIIFIIYNVYILKRFGTPESLSITTYLMGKNFWIFPLICFVFTATILPIWLNINPLMYECFKFFACSGILFVGATPFFKNDFDGKIHYVAAVISAISFIIWMLLNGFYVWLVVGLCIFISSLIFLNRKNVVYYGEVILWLMLLIFLI